MEKRKIIITGSAGFIGFHLSKVLIAEGYDVIGIDSVNDYYDVNLKHSRLAENGICVTNLEYNKPVLSSIFPNYTFVKLNLEDKQNLHNVFDTFKPDFVCNLAAQAGVRYSIENPQAYIDSNITGFFNILECCRAFSIKHLVYASSSSVYGLNQAMPFSTKHNVDHPISLYAASKKSNELMAHTYSYLFKIPTTGLRFFTVYGPWGRPDMALFIFTKAILEHKPINIFNNGNMLRDFTYVADIVEGIKRMIPAPPQPNNLWDGMSPNPENSVAPYRIYNIGNNKPEKLMDFILAIEKKLGIEAIKNFMPMQPGDVPATYADVSGLVSDFDYKPNTSINEGISNFIEWYRNFYAI